MSSEILTPVLPESVADATVVTWSKKVGDSVKQDEVLVEIETDKVVLEVPAPADGVLTEIIEQAGATVTSSQLLGRMTIGAVAAAPKVEAAPVAAATVAASAEPQTAPAARKLMAEKPAEFDPRSYLKPAIAAMRAVCEARYNAFGTAGQADKIKAIPLEKMATLYK